MTQPLCGVTGRCLCRSHYSQAARYGAGDGPDAGLLGPLSSVDCLGSQVDVRSNKQAMKRLVQELDTFQYVPHCEAGVLVSTHVPDPLHRLEQCRDSWIAARGLPLLDSLMRANEVAVRIL